MTTARRKTAIDPREMPAYSVAEAARYLRLPRATLRDWVSGREYTDGRNTFPRLIRPASRKPPLLSFFNLVEAHVLRSLRTEHGVTVQALRKAIGYAEKKLGIDRLLLRPELCTDAGVIFLDRYSELIELSASGQLAMRRVFEDHLKRVEWDGRIPVRLYPFLNASVSGDRTIAIDPFLGFGRPIVLSGAISTSTIADRIDAGEAVDDVASDYALDPSEVEQAIVYERAA
jgi:uncharacterized protein (DUF433 family)